MSDTSFALAFTPQPDHLCRAKALAAVYALLAELGRRARQEQMKRIKANGQDQGITVRCAPPQEAGGKG